ncbi:hypothetical protein ABTY59_26800 [Streptomyces sp. NPDC096079]|uniref:hypothetical protein n=1 Tax=Streptomyces sp. NPDC096079 TaxID=3155820 RepID=UPI0033256BD9
MQETTAALWAAVIGASSAVLVGGLAFWAAMRTVGRTAIVQREQSFWASRRDTYAKMMTSLQVLDRTGYECLASFKNGDFSDSHLTKVQEAAHAFEQVQFVMSLEAPHDAFLATALKGAAKRVRRVVTGVTAWHQDHADAIQTATDEQWFDDISREVSRMASVRNQLFFLMRNDLHREVGDAPDHLPGSILRRIWPHARRNGFERLMINRDLIPETDNQRSG